MDHEEHGDQLGPPSRERSGHHVDRELPVVIGERVGIAHSDKVDGGSKVMPEEENGDGIRKVVVGAIGWADEGPDAADGEDRMWWKRYGSRC